MKPFAGKPEVAPTRVALSLIALLVLTLSLANVLLQPERPLRGDAANYDAVAWNIVSGHGYSNSSAAPFKPTAFVPPGYPLFVALHYVLLGRNPRVVFVTQSILLSICCLLVFEVGRHAFRQPKPGLLGALLLSIYPPFLTTGGRLITETLSVTLLLASFVAFLRYVAVGSIRRFVPSALSLGLVSLCKPHMALVAIVYAYVVWRDRGVARGLQVFAGFTLIVALILSPWVVRNAVVFRAFVPGSTNGGKTFWGGTGPINGMSVGGLDDPIVPDSLRRALRALPEVEFDRHLYREGRRVIREHPTRFAGLAMRKAARLWFNLLFDSAPSRGSLLLALANLGLLALATIGVLGSNPGPTSAATRLALGLFVLFTIIHVAFFALVRYAIPVYAYLMCFSGAGLLRLARRQSA